MLVLTDDTGIAQHATFGTPDLHHGYCTDDNARALIAGVMARELGVGEEEANGRQPDSHTEQLSVALQRYLAFLNYAFDPETGRFRNFMGYDRRWLEAVGSQDSQARALWALGTATARVRADAITDLAEHLFCAALPALEQCDAIRPWAYGLLGICEYLKVHPEDEDASQRAEALGDRLLRVLRRNAKSDWPWWEDELTWGNAKLPHALIEHGRRTGSEAAIEAGEKALRWLLKVQTGEKGRLSIIGNNGWYTRNGRRACFDQQPIEAKALVQACLAAARVRPRASWADEAARCFEWFLGGNDLDIPVYNPETGGCYDGLMEDCVNKNQGAESTLAYVLSVLEIHDYARGAAVE